MPDIRLDNVRVVTMRQLSNGASDIVRQVNETNRPAVVTKHGRYVAVIQPLSNAEVESIALKGLAAAADLEDNYSESADMATMMQRLNDRRRSGN
ncbi:type II toxin-antitoxin system prevent-host-death family antitoxin [Streptomyces flavofungini]|uniref:type II toxin-antitoxin system prevent-host-death family antitoxin n=1 Tax=Streptomyces flavofungini TaxID=68200 RepID=UPI0034DDFD33